MKNLWNLAAGLMLLAVLGCNCSRFADIGKVANGTGRTPENTANNRASNTATLPARTADADAETYVLSKAKFERIKIGMTRAEVEGILGGPGTEVSSSEGGGRVFSVYKWLDADYSSVILTFRDDKVISRSQVGLK